MKIVFFETEEKEKRFFESNLKNHELVFFKENLDENLDFKEIKDAEIFCVFIYSNVNKKILNKFENLRAIVTRSTGFDHIDVKECKKNKIKVLNVPFYGANTVAEHAVALMLALSRKIVQSVDRTRKGNFSLEGLSGIDLKGKTLGIIGMGNIGSNVAKIGKSFGMNVLAYDVKKKQSLAKKIGFKYVGLENLLKESDFVSIHTFHNKKTHHLLNKERINLMKNGAFLINTSRGGIIDTGALVKALDEKKLSGVGLDVLEEEGLIREEIELLSKNYSKEKLSNLIENHMLLKFDNVIITPHNAFNSAESIQRILDTSLENIKSVVSKKKCENLIN